ncbi:MAG: hypothetical protein K2X57_06685 [Xanthobacteraceae bacterium]|nr:hypothetical protein [Xanthobacteraceae bacterium]
MNSEFPIDQALFGYADGHRQIAASVRLPSRDMYHLAAASDLAGSVSLAPGESYLTGLPLEETDRYALIRTWPAPEMPRPGCVWSHVLLLDQKVLTTFGNFSDLLIEFRPPSEVDRSFYSTALLPTANNPALSSPDRRVIAAVIAGYYSGSPTVVPPASDTASLEAAILSVWTQQWPKLRSQFSFRTAVASARRSKSNFDVQVSVSSVPTDGAEADWVVAATNDAASRRTTPLRRFLWRYGRDIAMPRSRYSHLVEFFMIANRQQEEMPLEVAKEILETLPDVSDGEILKRDMLGLGTSSLSLCSPVSFSNMLQLIQDDRLPAFTPGDLRRRLETIAPTDLAAAAKFLGDRPQDDPRWSELLDTVVDRADAELMRQHLPAAVVLHILLEREDLIDRQTLAELPSQDLPRLILRHADNEARKQIIEEALRRDVGTDNKVILSQEPELTFLLAIAAQRANDLHDSWRGAIRDCGAAVLNTDFLDRLRSLGDLSTAMYLLGTWGGSSGFNRDANAWAMLLPRLAHDASDADTLILYANLLVLALDRSRKGNWDLVVQTLPFLRTHALQGWLPHQAYQTLDYELPRIGKDTWDLNKRMLIALHRLHEAVPVSRDRLEAAALSKDDIDIVYSGIKEVPKPQSFFWWLGS